MSSRLVKAVVDAGALRHNLAAVRRFAPASKVLAVIKANAYGHGLVPTALALKEADGFAVARLEEGMALRGSGVTAPIILLEGVFDAEQLAEAARQEFELVVHSPEQVALLGESRGGHRFPVWVKLDSGMNRLGFRPRDFRTAYDALAASKSVAPRMRLVTHLANADDTEDISTQEQLDRFERSVAGLPLERSIANSAGVVGWPATHADWVRPGLMLYGVSPLKGRTAADHGLKSAMTLFSTVIAVKEVLRGEKVGYGGRWVAQRPTQIATVAVGYGDGYPQHVEDGTPVLVNGKRAGIAGRVSMDMIGVDVTDIPGVRCGDPVVLWGEGLPAELIAPYAETVPYDLLCAVSQRVALEFK